MNIGGKRAGRTVTFLVAGLVLLVSGPAQAATIEVGTTAEDSTATGAGCSLRAAIISANRSTARGGCTTGSAPGVPNTIRLAPGATYTLTQPDTPDGQVDRGSWYGPNGLPPITSTLVIEGNGATISRSAPAGTPYDSSS